MDDPGGEGISFEKHQPQDAPPGRVPPPGYPVQHYGAGPGYGGPAPYGPPPGYGGYPGYPYQPGPPPWPKPSSNIGWAIAAVFLFWPLCIPAFIFASRVDSAWYVGDYYGAQRASADARKFGMIGVIVGGSLIGLYLLFIVLLVVTV